LWWKRIVNFFQSNKATNLWRCRRRRRRRRGGEGGVGKKGRS